MRWGTICDAREEGTGLQCELRGAEHLDHGKRRIMHAARLSRRYVVRWNAYETRLDVAPLRLTKEPKP